MSSLSHSHFFMITVSLVIGYIFVKKLTKLQTEIENMREYNILLKQKLERRQTDNKGNKGNKSIGPDNDSRIYNWDIQILVDFVMNNQKYFSFTCYILQIWSLFSINLNLENLRDGSVRAIQMLFDKGDDPSYESFLSKYKEIPIELKRSMIFWVIVRHIYKDAIQHPDYCLALDEATENKYDEVVLFL